MGAEINFAKSETQGRLTAEAKLRHTAVVGTSQSLLLSSAPGFPGSRLGVRDVPASLGPPRLACLGGLAWLTPLPWLGGAPAECFLQKLSLTRGFRIQEISLLCPFCPKCRAASLVPRDSSLPIQGPRGWGGDGGGRFETTIFRLFFHHWPFALFPGVFASQR